MQRMQAYLLSLILRTTVRICLAQSTKEGQDILSGLHPSTVNFTGETFHSRQYPTKAELKRLTLRDLAALRPRDLQGAEKIHFSQLFASHNQVKKLKLSEMTSEDYIKSWVDLWILESVSSSSKQLPNAIKEHLKNDKLVPQDIFDEIVAQARLRRNRNSENRRRSRMMNTGRPKEIRKQGYNYIKESALKFQSMLYDNKIEVGFPADEIERESRPFRASLGGTQRTTIALRHFLRWRDSDEIDMIRRAMRNRSEFNRSTTKRVANSLQKGVNSRRKRPAIQKSRNDSDSAALIRSSRWWSS